MAEFLVPAVTIYSKSTIEKRTNCRVEIHGPVPSSGLVLSNHPTDIDLPLLRSAFPSRIPVYSIVGGSALSPQATVWDQMRHLAHSFANHLRGHLPVYNSDLIKDKQLRQQLNTHTFEKAAAVVRGGGVVLLFPEGQTTETDSGIVQELLHTGAIKEITQFNPDIPLVSAHIHHKSNERGNIAHISFGEPWKLPQSSDTSQIIELMCTEWRKISSPH